MRKGQLLAVCVLVVLAMTLSLERSPTAARWKAINEAIDAGSIASATLGQRAVLGKQLDWLSRAAGVATAIRLDERPSSASALSVYTTTPDAYEITGCARGNAVYDASLDAIFIDMELLEPAGMEDLFSSGYLSPHDLAFAPVFLRFVILHELGHRQLHAKSGGLFDTKAGDRTREEEADTFAISVLQDAYANDPTGIVTHSDPSPPQWIGLEVSRIAPSERPWVDLIAASAMMSWILMFSGSDFSSFYSDHAHPNFLTRSRSMLTAASGTNRLSPTVTANAAFYNAQLQRMANIDSSHFVELQLPRGVQGIAFSDNALGAVTNGSQFFAVSFDSMRRAQQPMRLTTLLTAPNPRIHDDFAMTYSFWGMPHGFVWGRPNEQLEIDAWRVDLEEKQSRLRSIQEFGSALSSVGGAPFAAAAPQPASFPVITAMDDIGSEGRLLVPDAQGRPTLVYGASIHRDVRRLTGLTSILLQIGTIHGRTAYLTIWDTASSQIRLYGFAAFDLALARTVSATRLDFMRPDGSQGPAHQDDRLVIFPTKPATHFLVSRDEDSALVYQVFEDAPMKLTSAHRLLIGEISRSSLSSDLAEAMDPSLSGAYWVPPNQILSIFQGDSVYLTDPASGVTQELFTPGSYIEHAISSRGDIALSVGNGRKVYVSLADRR